MSRLIGFRALPPAILTALLVLLAGCSHRTPEATIDVIDTSLSITPRAEKAALDAVQGQINHMQRGDILVVIPITGDAANDAGGRVLRLSAPTRRETYDADLRRFQEDAKRRFTAWAASLDSHQLRTDILGALDAARQEVALLPLASNRRLIVVSDFLEDDGTYRFVSDRSFGDPTSVHQLAALLREQHEFAVPGIPLCLGRLESADFAPLAVERKEAVDAFWTAYFGEGAKPIGIRFDGVGVLVNAEHGCSMES
jgi:hypothetical protein